ncbi:MAG: DUF3305 domain-containing protein [Burkholderiales bacterium]
MATKRPAIEVAVILRKERIEGAMSRWQTWRWVLDDVVEQEPGFGAEPRLLYKNDSGERWLHGGLRVELFEDDTEGYQLNVTTPTPGWFVLWRMEEEATVADEPIARPVVVSLSYHDASRWLDAQETVEQLPAPPAVVEWLKAFVAEFYQPEVKRPKRPESFKSLTDRFGNPASITTIKRHGSGDGSGAGSGQGGGKGKPRHG